EGRASMNRQAGFFAAASITVVVALSHVTAQPAGKAEGLAAKYPNDIGIAKDPRVIFADNFDTWEVDSAKIPPTTWDAVRQGDNPKQRQTLIVPGKVTLGNKD